MKFYRMCRILLIMKKKVIDELKWWDIKELNYEVENNNLCLFPRGLNYILLHTFSQIKNNCRLYNFERTLDIYNNFSAQSNFLYK